jgi:hypothetical protein
MQLSKFARTTTLRLVLTSGNPSNHIPFGFIAAAIAVVACETPRRIATVATDSSLGSGIESGTGHGAFSLSEVFGSSLSGFTLAVPVPSASLAARHPTMRANCLSTTRRFEGLSVGSVEGAIAPYRLDENAGKNTVMALTVSGHARAHAEKPNAP